MFRGVVILALLAGLALPATAAAARPGVTTGGAANLTDTTVSLNGSVNPKGKDTQYFFQYGLNKLYGSQTPATRRRRRERRLGGQRPGRRRSRRRRATTTGSSR